jgi:eukaryotic-like serine/threonine-protein kinase
VPGATSALDRLIRDCLVKDRDERRQTMHDVVLELRYIKETGGASPAPADAEAPPARSARLAWIVAALALVAGAAGLAIPRMGRVAPETIQASLLAPEHQRFNFRDGLIEISPDGRHVAFVANDESGKRSLWVRSFAEAEARKLPGTEDAYFPFWSPDNASLAFFAQGKLRKVEIRGGPATNVCAAGNEPRGGSWSNDGTILFSPDWSVPLMSVTASGKPQEATRFDPARQETSHRWPSFLPDGRHFLFYVVGGGDPARNPSTGIYVGSLDSPEVTFLLGAQSRASFVDGSLYYVEEGALMMRPFDPDRLRFEGDPVVVAPQVTQQAQALWGGGLFSVSEGSTLAYVSGFAEGMPTATLTWLDRTGKQIGTVGEPGQYASPRLSHDGKRLAVTSGDPGDILLFDLERQVSARFTFDEGNDGTPIWSPDDADIVFQSARESRGDLFHRVASGVEADALLYDAQTFSTPTDWSPDGKWIVFEMLTPGRGYDLWRYSVADKTAQTFIDGPSTESFGRFSPDGRWIAYYSSDSDRAEVYVRPFPTGSGKWQVSRDGGDYPSWRGDGKEIYFMQRDGRLMAAPVSSGNSFQVGAPVQLFQIESLADTGQARYDVAPDGSRFLFLIPVEGVKASAASITLVHNWKQRLAASTR